MCQNELKSSAFLGFPLDSYIFGFVLCEWWNNFQSLQSLKSNQSLKGYFISTEEIMCMARV